jgi:hypothetical protein
MLAAGARQEVVEADDLDLAAAQLGAQVAAQEAGAAGLRRRGGSAGPRPGW